MSPLCSRNCVCVLRRRRRRCRRRLIFSLRFFSSSSSFLYFSSSLFRFTFVVVVTYIYSLSGWLACVRTTTTSTPSDVSRALSISVERVRWWSIGDSRKLHNSSRVMVKLFWTFVEMFVDIGPIDWFAFNLQVSTRNYNGRTFFLLKSKTLVISTTRRNWQLEQVGRDGGRPAVDMNSVSPQKIVSFPLFFILWVCVWSIKKDIWNVTTIARDDFKSLSWWLIVT